MLFAMLFAATLAAPARAADDYDLAHALQMHRVPDLCPAPSARTVADGPWSAPSTWEGGQVPGAGAAVLVSHAVSYDLTISAPFACVRVDPAGTVRFLPDVDTRLRVGTLFVLGALEVGTPAAPVTARAEISITDSPMNTAADPDQMGHGVIGLGRVTMCGMGRWPTFARTTAEPLKGAASFTFGRALDGWQPGDLLVGA